MNILEPYTESAPKFKNFIAPEIEQLLNYRINQEELSSRIYLAMSICLKDKGYFNAAKLWAKYSAEELTHATWAREYLESHNILPATLSIGEVENYYESLIDVIDKTLEHEILITEQCSELAKACLESADMLTFTLASKYCKEQSEELGKAWDIKNLMETYGKDRLNLALLDHQLAEYI